MTTNQIPKQVTKAPSGAAVSSVINNNLYHLLKTEIRASIVLARNYRLSGERRLAIQFLNDAALCRQELSGLIHAPT